MDIQSGVNGNLVSAYDALYVAGSALLILLVVASDIRHKNVFRRAKVDYNDVRRPSMWFIAVLSWITLGISFCLLLGNQIGQLPPHAICLTQAILIYSSPTFCAFSAVAFLLQVHLSMSRPRYCSLSTLHQLTLYVIAFLVPLGIFLEALVLGLVHPSWVQRDPTGMYCNFSLEKQKKITGGFILCGLIAVLVLEVMISLSYLRAAQASQKASQALVHALEIKIEDYRRQSISGRVLARILGFTLCVLIAMSCSLIQYLPYNAGINFGTVNIVQATLPCCAALIFGTQKDIWKVWS
ncbi:hypothetical protein D9619_004859 [Psilocybe cf. subviscida]|uniref:Uncharacterized protein n=1 Tax=Psilocybe cf. subviscida TaxID=2480587 RepID=A0A8H5BPC6_9AGAR|nr:hypothetical protein D9619_004859 [Psilocybe cf. subviscida]